MELDFIVMTTAFGGRDITHLQKVIPNLQTCVDYTRKPMENFLKSLLMSENASVHLEDDIELCDGFYEKITEAIKQYPDCVINFFSLRSKDYELQKPYFELGSKYLMNQCFYLPKGYGQQIAEFYKSWERKDEHPTGFDVLIADWLKTKKMKYLQWFPHLVNHLEGKSLINPKRSSKRVDKNFTK